MRVEQAAIKGVSLSGRNGSNATTFLKFLRIVELCHETSLLGLEEGEQRVFRSFVLTTSPSDEITSQTDFAAATFCPMYATFVSLLPSRYLIISLLSLDN